MTVDDHSTAMEVDTAIALLLVSETTFKKLWPGMLLLTSKGEIVLILRSVVGCQEYRSQVAIFFIPSCKVASFPGHRRNVSPTAWEQV